MIRGVQFEWKICLKCKFLLLGLPLILNHSHLPVRQCVN
jgi:hypothetical protein